jgi:hypothetical protein
MGYGMINQGGRDLEFTAQKDGFDFPIYITHDVLSSTGVSATLVLWVRVKSIAWSL